MRLIKKLAVVFKIGMCVYVVYCLIARFTLIKSEIISALSMWSNVILPSVFPYLVISGYITKSDILLPLEKIFGRFFGFLFGISPGGISCIICSLFCGYPSGAMSASMLYEKGEIEKNEAQRLICFTNNAGPLFLVSAVGACLLGSAKDGFAIYIIQIISAFIYAIFTRDKNKAITSPFKKSKKKAFDFCTCIKDSVTAIVNICGFMVVAYVMAACVIAGIDEIFGDVAFTGYIKIIVKSVFEISAGVKEICLADFGDGRFGFICAAVSWSGVCVILQIKSVSKDIISTTGLCRAKLFQAILSFFMGYAYKSFYKSYEFSQNGGYGIGLSLGISVVLFLIYLFFARKKLSEKF